MSDKEQDCKDCNKFRKINNPAIMIGTCGKDEKVVTKRDTCNDFDDEDEE